ncbi:MAG TPA: hypothetical protein VI278_00665 [Nitrososphaeraceae archaeon]
MRLTRTKEGRKEGKVIVKKKIRVSKMRRDFITTGDLVSLLLYYGCY